MKCENCGLNVEEAEEEWIRDFGLSRKEKWCYDCYYLYQNGEFEELERRENENKS